MGGAGVSAVLVINVMVTTVVRKKKKSSRHILHQYNCFGSQPGGAQGNITENSQHLIPSPSFAMTFFSLLLFFVPFFFFSFNENCSNLGRAAPGSARLCSPVSGETLKPLFYVALFLY